MTKQQNEQTSGTSDVTTKGRTKTQQALSSISLTDMVSRGTSVPGVSGLAQSDAPQSLYQVQEVLIEDILDSDYQTREKVTPERYRRLVKSMKEVGPKEFKDAIPVRVHPKVAGKWQVARGGHTRLKAARDAGLSRYPIIVVEYDNRRTALATGRENLARADELSPVEEGRYYLLMKQDFGDTQESLAEEFGISRDRIKECEAAAKSPQYIIDMFLRIKEMGGGSNRGLRAAKYLRRLASLDERQEGLAARLAAPLIDAFVYERITTDGLDLMTNRIVKADDPEEVVANFVRELHRNEEQAEQETRDTSKLMSSPQARDFVPEIQRTEKLGLTMRRFRQFRGMIGEHAPSEDERKVLVNMREEIDALLTR